MASAHIVVDLGFGDSGKGIVVDKLVREHNADGVVRYGGGGQCAHNVVLPDGTHHTFSMFSSGTFAGVMTYLSKHVLVNPHKIMTEAVALSQILGETPVASINRMAIQTGALITTPFHIAANRIREKARGQNRHGSCGMGIGETVAADKAGFHLRARDLHDPVRTRQILVALSRYLRAELADIVPLLPDAWNDIDAQVLVNPAVIDDAVEGYQIFASKVRMFKDFDFSDGVWVFEGHQGVLLDEYVGFHPHTTWAKTTTANAYDLLGEALNVFDAGDVRVYGVTRSYMTRHGAGPFVTEDPELHERFPEAHNGHGEWQGAWRVGWTDLAMLRYAIEAQSVDELVITHMDRVEGPWKICVGYEGASSLKPPRPGIDRRIWEANRADALRFLADARPFYLDFEWMTPEDLAMFISAGIDVPVTMTSYGPTHEDVCVVVPA